MAVSFDSGYAVALGPHHKAVVLCNKNFPASDSDLSFGPMNLILIHFLKQLSCQSHLAHITFLDSHVRGQGENFSA